MSPYFKFACFDLPLRFGLRSIRETPLAGYEAAEGGSLGDNIFFTSLATARPVKTNTTKKLFISNCRRPTCY